MTHSATSSEYIIQPPSFPDFVFKRSAIPYRELISWAEAEYRARLEFCAKNGYYKEHTRLTAEWSAKRILSQLSGFRRYCALLNERVWNELERRQRRLLEDAFFLRDLIMRD